ncbi:MAG: response regulator [Bacteroidetes bacterium]|nr:response regulator [Bacteroidota bacterium]
MKKLLFIGDNRLDYFILKRILRRYDLAYEVSCTSDEQEVIGLLQQNEPDKHRLPDIIISDISMPGIDGWGFLEQLQALHTSLAQPVGVYILSSSIDPRDIQRSKLFPCVKSFIFKPITKEVLERLVSEEARYRP